MNDSQKQETFRDTERKLREKIDRYEKALLEIQRFVDVVGEPFEIYNIAEKALRNK